MASETRDVGTHKHGVQHALRGSDSRKAERKSWLLAGAGGKINARE